MPLLYRKSFASVFLLFLSWTAAATPTPTPSPQTCGTKIIVGPTIYIRTEETNLVYLARVDSGATKVSLRAWDIQINDQEKDMRDNIGKIIRFRTANEKGVETTAQARIVDTVSVRSANGVERRYVIEITLGYQGVRKVVRANLSERRGMTYPLLLGRNWLSGSYIIDVDLPEYRP